MSLLDLLSSIIALLLGITIHEFCHAWVADRLGDPTAKIYGRVSLNPLRHLDLYGTLALLLVGIGWGKPVPVNDANFRSPKRDHALVSLAGPLSNLLLALLFFVPIKYLADTSFEALPLYRLMVAIFSINLTLFALNILPFPPFDGASVIGIFVPRRYHNIYENYLQNGMKYVIIFILFDVMVIDGVYGHSILGTVLTAIKDWASIIIFQLT